MSQWGCVEYVRLAVCAGIVQGDGGVAQVEAGIPRVKESIVGRLPVWLGPMGASGNTTVHILLVV